MSSPQESTSSRVILIGIGGPSCSGKTTISKLLHRVIPQSILIHQDDFGPQKEEDIPMHPIHGILDWDEPEGAIEWPRMIDFLKQVKQTGEIPQDHITYEHFNSLAHASVSDEMMNSLRAKIAAFTARLEEKGQSVTYVLVDGFLLYWHPGITSQLDVKVFLRVPRETLKARRQGREYNMPGVWADPPDYFDKIVWPAYEKAHKGLFENGDYVNGLALTSEEPAHEPGQPVPGLFVVDGRSNTGDILESAVDRILLLE